MSFLKKYKSKNAPEKAASKRMSKSKEWFARLTVSRVEALKGPRSHACWILFSALCLESFRVGGKPFPVPDDISDLTEVSRGHLRRALRQLEECGLISIRRQPPKPPLITIL
jgi:hypothetical protein